MTTDDLNDDQVNEPGRLRQMYEETARQAAEANARAEAAERREMFRDAGLDLTNRQHQAFVKAYEGDLDPEAVRSYVNDLGVTEQAPPPPPPPATTASNDEQAALVRIAEAARDGAPPPSPDREAQAERELDEAIRLKRSPAEIDRLSIAYARARGGVTSQDNL